MYCGRSIVSHLVSVACVCIRGVSVIQGTGLEGIHCIQIAVAVKHGDCPSESGQIIENVGVLRCWILEAPLYGPKFW